MPRWVRLRLGMRVMSRPNSSTDAAVRRSSPVMRLNKRGLAGTVRADDQPALARIDVEIDAGGDAQTAERFAQGG